jgi:hypothetical protein
VGKRLNSLRPPSFASKKQKRVDSPPSQEKPHFVYERKSVLIKSKYNSNLGNPTSEEVSPVD